MFHDLLDSGRSGSEVLDDAPPSILASRNRICVDYRSPPLVPLALGGLTRSVGVEDGDGHPASGVDLIGFGSAFGKGCDAD